MTVTAFTPANSDHQPGRAGAVAFKEISDPADADFYWKPGMQLRPIPPGKDQFGDLWLHFRQTVFGDWFAVEPQVSPSDLTRMFDDHLWQGDEYMDPIVDMFERLGHARGRALFEQALTEGLDSVEDAPRELVCLFTKYEIKPEWYDTERGIRGQRRLKSASMAGIIGAMGFGIFDTIMNTDVSATTGATGRMKTDPVGRIAESGKYFGLLMQAHAAEHPGRGTEAYEVALRVRLMHALVRKGLMKRWGPEHYVEFGNPISNSMMCGFMEGFMLFLLMDHVFGRKTTRSDLEDAWHFLSYWTYMAGVADELVPRNAIEAMRNLDYLVARDAGPSEWKVEMVEALFCNPEMPARTRQAFIWATAATGQVTFGDKLTSALFEGTSLESYDSKRAGRQLLAFTTATIAFTKFRDRIPGIWYVRRRGISAIEIFLKLFFSGSERIAKERGIATDFRSHDKNGQGGNFEKSGL